MRSSQSSGIGVVVKGVWSSPSTCPMTAMCRWSQLSSDWAVEIG